MTKTNPIPTKSGRNRTPMITKKVPPGIRCILQAVEALQGAQGLSPENQEVVIKTLVATLPDLNDWHVHRATRWMREWADWVESEEYQRRSQAFADRTRFYNELRRQL